MQNRATATISAILVDDEKLASEELAYQLKEFPDIEILAIASNGLEAVKLIQSMEPDLVFLDVQMPGLDGMGVIRKLRELDIPLHYFFMATKTKWPSPSRQRPNRRCSAANFWCAATSATSSWTRRMWSMPL